MAALRLTRRAVVAVAALAVACGAEPPPPESPAAVLGRGFVVWESNREGEFRIFRRDLAADAVERLSPPEAGRDHCCAAISPDGRRLVYLSLAAGQGGYFDGQGTGELRLIDLERGAARTLAPAARTYSEHRAAIWWGDAALVFIDGDGRTQRLDLSSGASEALIDRGAAAFGWLIEPSGRFATSGEPTFSRVDRERREVVPQPRLGGCQPAFSSDGRWGVWAAGAGGPIEKIDLASRARSTLLRKFDPRLPDGLGYLYFPLPSRDGRVLALAASRGEHDHFRADYELLAVATDPATLEPRGPVVRLTDHPATDRFPDVWTEPRRGGVPAPVLAATPALAPRAVEADADLLFAWPHGEANGLVRLAGRASERADLVAWSGRAWLDRTGRLALGGGAGTVPWEMAAAIASGLRDANELAVELTVEPWSLGERGTIFDFGWSADERALALRQEGERLLLVMQTSSTPRSGSEPIEIGRLAALRPHRLAIGFSPGRLSTWIDGRPQLEDHLLPDDFFHWRASELRIGQALGGGSAWRGWVEGFEIRGRVPSAGDPAVPLARRQAAAAVARLTVDARLVAASQPAALERIAPYREALVLQEFEVERVLEGAFAGRRLRVARWSHLDRRAEPPLAPGARLRLLLEPWAEQRVAQSLFLADGLPEDWQMPLFLDVGLDPRGGAR